MGESVVCGSCGNLIDPEREMYAHHARLNADVHMKDKCLRNLKGEDVTMHAMYFYGSGPING